MNSQTIWNLVTILNETTSKNSLELQDVNQAISSIPTTMDQLDNSLGTMKANVLHFCSLLSLKDEGTHNIFNAIGHSYFDLSITGNDECHATRS